MCEIILSKEEILEVNKRIGSALTEKFKNNKVPPIFIGVLKGALPFMMGLIKEVKCYIELDFIQYSSYLKQSSTGIVMLKKDISTDVAGRDVVICEDIVDTGRTLAKLQEYLAHRGAKSITTCVLLDKQALRQADCKVDFAGKVIEDKFVVGYGLDYQEYLRNTEEVTVITPTQLKEIDEIVGE